MIPIDVRKEIDFIKSSEVISVIGWWDDSNFHASLKKIYQTTSKKVSIVSYNESFKSKERVDIIKNILDKKDVEYYISADTSTKFDKFFNPLTNIYFWKDTTTRDGVWEQFRSIKLFEESDYESDFDKSINGILSMRRTTPPRKYLDSIIDKESFNGIYRFVKTPYNALRPVFEKKHLLNDSSSVTEPNTKELISEYKKTYISFVMETSLSPPNNKSAKDSHFINPLTEKTLIPFLTKTMPIVLGGKNFVRELKDMGFYVWNEEFGFGDADSLESGDFDKIDRFNDCITNFNKMDTKQISELYNKNIDKIEQNYNLVSSLLFEDKDKIKWTYSHQDL